LGFQCGGSLFLISRALGSRVVSAIEAVVLEDVGINGETNEVWVRRNEVF